MSIGNFAKLVCCSAGWLFALPTCVTILMDSDMAFAMTELQSKAILREPAERPKLSEGKTINLSDIEQAEVLEIVVEENTTLEPTHIVQRIALDENPIPPDSSTSGGLTSTTSSRSSTYSHEVSLIDSSISEDQVIHPPFETSSSSSQGQNHNQVILSLKNEQDTGPDIAPITSQEQNHNQAILSLKDEQDTGPDIAPITINQDAIGRLKSFKKRVADPTFALSESEISNEQLSSLRSSIETPNSQLNSSCERALNLRERQACYQNQRETAERAFADARDRQDRSAEAQALLDIGNASFGLEDYSRARESFQEAIERFGTDFPDIRSNALIGSALASIRLQQAPATTELAIREINEALVITQSLQPVSQSSRLLRIATFFYVLGESSESHANFEQAIILAQQALDVSRQLGNRPFDEIGSLALLGSTYQSLNQYAEAVKAYQQIPLIYREIGDQIGQANALVKLAEVYSTEAKYLYATSALEQALSIFEAQDNSLQSTAAVHLRLAELYLSQGLVATTNQDELLEKAAASASSALHIFEQISRPEEDNDQEDREYVLLEARAGIAKSQELLGSIYLAQGLYTEGLASLRSSSASLQEVRERILDDQTVGLLEDLALIGDAIGILQFVFPPLGAIGFIANIGMLLSLADDVPVLFEGALNVLGEVQSFVSRDEQEKVINELEEQLAIIRESGSEDRASELRLLTQIGTTYLNFQDYSKAEDRFKETLTIIDENSLDESFAFERAKALQALADIANARGENAQALERGRQALEIFQELQSEFIEGSPKLAEIYRIGEAQVRLALSATALKVGNYSSALEEAEIALEIFGSLGDNYLAQEAKARLAIGRVNLRMRHYGAVLEQAERAREIFQDLGNLGGLANSLLLLSDAQLSLGSYRDSLQNSQRALRLFQSLDDQVGRVGALSLIGSALQSQRRFQEAADFFDLSNELQQEIVARVNPEEGLLATIYRLGGPLLNTALSIFINNPFDLYDAQQFVQNIGTALFFAEGTFAQLGVEHAYISIGEYSKAVESYKRSRRIAEGIGDRIAVAQASLGLSNLYLGEENYDDALEEAQAALEIFQASDDRFGQGFTLVTLAQAYLGLGRQEGNAASREALYQQAFTSAQEALLSFTVSSDLPSQVMSLDTALKEQMINNKPFIMAIQASARDFCEGDDRYATSLAYSSIGDVLAAQQQDELAILYYKQAVNCREQIRREVETLTPQFQRTYTGTLLETYRNLVNLLLRLNRVDEALHVMELLRIQEVDNYLGRTTRSDNNTFQITNSSEEEIWLRLLRHLEISKASIGYRRFSELNQIILDGGELTPQQEEERRRLDASTRAYIEGIQGFLNSDEIRTWIDELSDVAASRTVPPERLIGFDAVLEKIKRETGRDVALLYPVVLQDRLEVILVRPDGFMVNQPVPEANRLELNRLITRYLTSLARVADEQTIRVHAGELYNWLIKPVAQFLPNSEDPILLYAPDSQLRYVPLAALFDGNQWLAERFQINYVTAESLAKFIGHTPRQPRVLAGAVTQPAINFEVNGETFSFTQLDFTNVEVSEIVSLLPQGRTQLYLDGDLTLDTVLLEMTSSTIVHLATHARFEAERRDLSFIVLGGNQYITLEQLDRSSENFIRRTFTSVELIVLSACETARGIGDTARETFEDDQSGGGEEVLSFGYLMQELGIGASIASLWRVDDGGTSALMQAFYYALLRQNMPPTEALATAQRFLIGSDTSTLQINREDFMQQLAIELPGLSQTVPYLSHPYYWAPFILTGNGLW